MLHYLNGKWVAPQDFKISALDILIIRGYGIFDLIRTYDGKLFMPDHHLDRLFHSARLLDLPVPHTKKELKTILLQGLKKNNLKETTMRLVLTGGISTDLITPGKPSFFIIFKPLRSPAAVHYKEGIKVVTYPAHRTLPEAKSANYLMGVLAFKEAVRQGAHEALYVDTDKKRIYEATGSNFFAVIDGMLVTPEKEVLHGVTRNIVLDLANKTGLKVRKQDIFTKNIPSFQEAFITATIKEILPVTAIDNKRVGDGKIGEVTKRLMAEFRKFTKTAK